ncbi:hypothetical protein R1flu_025297 [Riccia fluitans]|uniref:Uncharacterized protein n=1 Tax=Riccia fluitans TaxID=41844 RepID=A0ABD1XXC3_9MARC
MRPVKGGGKILVCGTSRLLRYCQGLPCAEHYSQPTFTAALTARPGAGFVRRHERGQRGDSGLTALPFFGTQKTTKQHPKPQSSYLCRKRMSLEHFPNRGIKRGSLLLLNELARPCLASTDASGVDEPTHENRKDKNSY